LSRRSCSSTVISAVTFLHTYTPQKQPINPHKLDRRKPHQVSSSSKAPRIESRRDLGRLPRYVHRQLRSSPRSHAGLPCSSSSYWARARSLPCSDPHIAPRLRGAGSAPSRSAERLEIGESQRDTARQILAPGSSKRRGTGSSRGSQAVSRGGRSGGGGAPRAGRLWRPAAGGL